MLTNSSASTKRCHEGGDRFVDYAELLNDPCMRNLIRAKSRAYLTWDDFLDMPLPAGMGAKSTWNALQMLFRSMGVDAVESSIRGHRVWYHRTAELSNAIMRIYAECGESSEIEQTIKRSSGRHFLSEMRIDDSIASAKIGGLVFSEVSIEDMLRLDSAPVTGAEAYIRNCYKSDEEIARHIDEPFSPDLFREFYHLVAGAKGEGYPGQGVLRNSFALLGVEPMDNEDVDRFLEFLAGYANNLDQDPADNEVFRAFVILESMHSASPFGAFSAQVARMIFKLYALKNGLPVLAVLPISKARLDWKEGRIAPPYVSCSNQALSAMADRIVTGDSVDLTLPQTILAQLTLIQVEQVKAKIKTWNERDEKVRRLLQQEAGFNSRQRSVIARAMRSPDATFTIRYHQNNHGVSYATARHDLMELMEEGFLEMQPQGRAFVFMPSSELAERIESHEL